MSSSTHNITVRGKDATAGAFASIEARAAAAGRRISSIMGGAIAAAGAYLSVRSITGAAQELGKLSDLAMKSGASVRELTQASTAFQIAGLDISTEALAKSFQHLRKATGEGGMEHFYKTAQTIAAIEDPAKRGAELVRNFGRAGLELQPLIDGGAEAIQKMQTLADIMPGVSDAAANAGDEAADALAAFGTGAKNLFLKVVGSIVGMWAEDFPGGVRAGALNAINWVEYALKKMYHAVVRWGAEIGNVLQGVWNWAANGYSWRQAVDEMVDNSIELDKEHESKMAAIEKSRADYVEKLKSLNVDDLANAFGRRSPRAAKAAAEEAGKAAAEHAVRITNQLMAGNSNAQRRLEAMGPQYNEARKQTDLLKKIEQNTAKTAEEVEQETYPVTDVGA